MRVDRQAFLLYALVGVACIVAAWLVAGRPLPNADDGTGRAATSAAVAFPPTASIELTGEHLLGSSLVSAFVATGSTSRKCLLTLAESNAASPGATVFCARRRYRGADGVILRIYLSPPPPASLQMTATVYHEGAERYGPPILYSG